MGGCKNTIYSRISFVNGLIFGCMLTAKSIDRHTTQKKWQKSTIIYRKWWICVNIVWRRYLFRKKKKNTTLTPNRYEYEFAFSTNRTRQNWDRKMYKRFSENIRKIYIYIFSVSRRQYLFFMTS
jgi:hypothetical protein